MPLMPAGQTPDQDTLTGARVADDLAEASLHGSASALAYARTCSDEELRLGMTFVTTVLEVASLSARAMALAQAERARPPSVRPWN
jgi:hypothetical protein